MCCFVNFFAFPSILFSTKKKEEEEEISISDIAHIIIHNDRSTLNIHIDERALHVLCMFLHEQDGRQHSTARATQNYLDES